MKRESKITGRQVETAIRTQIIPWVQSGAPIVLLQPPPTVISYARPNIPIRETPVPPLPAQHGIGREVRIQQWHEENLNALNVPYWGCVMDGEADLVIEVTKEVSRARKIKPTRWVISLSAGTLFWLPPGIAITMSGLHWERPEPEKSQNRIFWMLITPAGVNCHFCSTSQGKHWIHPSIFAPGTHLLQLGWRITQELEEQRADHLSVVSHTLQLLLLDTIRGLKSSHRSQVPSQLQTSRTSREEADLIIQRAVHYIDEHFSDPGLTTAKIARHSRVSPSHLNRLFRQVLQTTVREMIIEKRFAMARQLLTESTFNVRQIALYCGYSHASTFITAFEKRYQKSPLSYRYEQRAAPSNRFS